MRQLLIVVVAVAASIVSPAGHAAEDGIARACAHAAALYAGVAEVEVQSFQSFPDLQQPRVKLTVGVASEVKPDAVAAALGAQPAKHRSSPIEVRCEFDSITAPHKLSSFCLGDGCILGKSRGRLEELQSLMLQAGY